MLVFLRQKFFAEIFRRNLLKAGNVSRLVKNWDEADDRQAGLRQQHFFYFGARVRRPASISVLIRETLIDGTSKKSWTTPTWEKKKFSQNAIFKKKKTWWRFISSSAVQYEIWQDDCNNAGREREGVCEVGGRKICQLSLGSIRFALHASKSAKTFLLKAAIFSQKMVTLATRLCCFTWSKSGLKGLIEN